MKKKQKYPYTIKKNKVPTWPPLDANGIPTSVSGGNAPEPVIKSTK